MKIFKNKKHIKTIPKKFKPICNGFEFNESKKRLFKEERDELCILLTNYKIKNYFNSLEGDFPQAEYVLGFVKKENIKSVIIVRKRGDNKLNYRIRFKNSVEITVPYYVICHYPKENVIKYNEL